ncbi:unnamed protein product [Rotaria sordida]|uniref:Mitochondrial import inner membrane translocase subunit TIM50 n=1 Tax=Rotaria sordida TaxID=392033 RepID=A0A815BG65_9BILA|nr:unnamed protein product [Rotaria sordida]CAF1546783.1 unnamed protein product [Rotaria sordida]
MVLYQRKLLILDIDGTMIFAEEKANVIDMQVEQQHHFELDDGSILVWKRPGIDEFLEWCFEHYDIGIWSASGSEYVHSVLTYIIPDHLRSKIKVITRESRAPSIVARVFIVHPVSIVARVVSVHPPVVSLGTGVVVSVVADRLGFVQTVVGSVGDLFGFVGTVVGIVVIRVFFVQTVVGIFVDRLVFVGTVIVNVVDRLVFVQTVVAIVVDRRVFTQTRVIALVDRLVSVET